MEQEAERERAAVGWAERAAVIAVYILIMAGCISVIAWVVTGWVRMFSAII